MNTYEKKIKLKFKILSKIYGLMDIVYFPNRKTNPRYGLLDNLTDEKQSLLDVCFGAGHSAILIAGNRANIDVTGIDISPEMIALAQKKIRKARLAGIKTYEMDATNMVFGDETFDIATVSLSLHEMSPEIVEKTLSEIFRVLKKGGFLYIIEWAVPRHFLKRIFFKLTIPIMEPRTFKDFMKIDWKDYLTGLGYIYQRIDRYSYTQFIVAYK